MCPRKWAQFVKFLSGAKKMSKIWWKNSIFAEKQLSKPKTRFVFAKSRQNRVFHQFFDIFQTMKKSSIFFNIFFMTPKTFQKLFFVTMEDGARIIKFIEFYKTALESTDDGRKNFRKLMADEKISRKHLRCWNFLLPLVEIQKIVIFHKFWKSSKTCF